MVKAEEDHTLQHVLLEWLLIDVYVLLT